MLQAPELTGVRMSNHFRLTEERMERSTPFFPKSHRKPRVDDRRVLIGMIFINRNGLRWCDAPWEYGPRGGLCPDDGGIGLRGMQTGSGKR